jgi:hypothetical protein
MAAIARNRKRKYPAQRGLLLPMQDFSQLVK